MSTTDDETLSSVGGGSHGGGGANYLDYLDDSENENDDIDGPRRWADVPENDMLDISEDEDDMALAELDEDGTQIVMSFARGGAGGSRPKRSGKNLDIDEPEFDAAAFLAQAHATTNMEGLKAGLSQLRTTLSSREDSMKKLVRDNFFLFISCKDTIDSTQVLGSDSKDGKGRLDHLTQIYASILKSNNQVFSSIIERRKEIEKRKKVLDVLQRFSFLFSVPESLRKFAEASDSENIVRTYTKWQGWTSKNSVKDNRIFQSVVIEVDKIIEGYRQTLYAALAEGGLPPAAEDAHIHALVDLDAKDDPGWFALTHRHSRLCTTLKECNEENKRQVLGFSGMLYDRSRHVVNVSKGIYTGPRGLIVIHTPPATVDTELVTDYSGEDHMALAHLTKLSVIVLSELPSLCRVADNYFDGKYVKKAATVPPSGRGLSGLASGESSSLGDRSAGGVVGSSGGTGGRASDRKPLVTKRGEEVVIKEGILLKQSGTYRTWQQRLFKKVGTSLMYFRTMDETTPAEVIDCVGVSARPSKDPKRPFCFELYRADGGQVLGRKTLVLDAVTSAANMNEWIASISESMTPIHVSSASGGATTSGGGRANAHSLMPTVDDLELSEMGGGAEGGSGKMSGALLQAKSAEYDAMVRGVLETYGSTLTDVFFPPSGHTEAVLAAAAGETLAAQALAAQTDNTGSGERKFKTLKAVALAIAYSNVHTRTYETQRILRPFMREGIVEAVKVVHALQKTVRVPTYLLGGLLGQLEAITQFVVEKLCQSSLEVNSRMYLEETWGGGSDVDFLTTSCLHTFEQRTLKSMRLMKDIVPPNHALGNVMQKWLYDALCAYLDSLHVLAFPSTSKEIQQILEEMDVDIPTPTRRLAMVLANCFQFHDTIVPSLISSFNSMFVCESDFEELGFHIEDVHKMSRQLEALIFEGYVRLRSIELFRFVRVGLSPTSLDFISDASVDIRDYMLDILLRMVIIHSEIHQLCSTHERALLERLHEVVLEGVLEALVEINSWGQSGLLTVVCEMKFMQNILRKYETAATTEIYARINELLYRNVELPAAWNLATLKSDVATKSEVIVTAMRRRCQRQFVCFGTG